MTTCGKLDQMIGEAARLDKPQYAARVNWVQKILKTYLCRNFSCIVGEVLDMQ